MSVIYQRCIGKILPLYGRYFWYAYQRKQIYTLLLFFHYFWVSLVFIDFWLLEIEIRSASPSKLSFQVSSWQTRIQGQKTKRSKPCLNRALTNGQDSKITVQSRFTSTLTRRLWIFLTVLSAKQEPVCKCDTATANTISTSFWHTCNDYATGIQPNVEHGNDESAVPVPTNAYAAANATTADAESNESGPIQYSSRNAEAPRWICLLQVWPAR